MHRIIACNKWLYNIKIKESSKCNFCEAEDNLLHFFFYCKNTEMFWHSFFNWWHRTSDVNIEETLEEHMLFGYPGNSDIDLVLNFCILLGKWYIFTIKMQEKNSIDFYEYLVQLKQRLLIEKEICTKQDNPQASYKWDVIYENL